MSTSGRRASKPAQQRIAGMCLSRGTATRKDGTRRTRTRGTAARSSASWRCCACGERVETPVSARRCKETNGVGEEWSDTRRMKWKGGRLVWRGRPVLERFLEQLGVAVAFGPVAHAVLRHRALLSRLAIAHASANWHVTQLSQPRRCRELLLGAELGRAKEQAAERGLEKGKGRRNGKSSERRGCT
eukprot:669334-Rhodomonas_salina.1